MPIQLPVIQTGLEASIHAAAQRAGRNLKIDLGVSSRSIGGLSQPLGKITGQADQFTKSMEAANARVLAFGASVGVLSAVAQGFREIIAVTIQVEKNMADINSVLGANSTQLNKFKNDIFSVAKETGNSFQTVSDAALELSRQGLKPVEVLTRLKDSMILSRLSGLDAASSVEGLTAAVNSFSKEGVTTSQVLNKISKTAAAFSVSERDLIEGFKRSASVAQQAGVSLDELGGIITAVQEKTARGGSVIGNAFKTIFTRIQRPDSLALLQEVGAQVTDVQGRILPATKLIENLAQKISSLNDIQVANITEKIGGGFQVGPLIAALDDITSKTSTFKGATEAMSSAGSEAYKRNIALNQTLAASINTATVNLQELANTLGEIGVTDSLKNILSFFNSFATDVKEVLQGEGLGSDFAKGLVKGISAVLSGPGLLLFAAIIGKLALNFVQFGAAALKTFFNIGSAAKEIGAIQSSIASTLLNNKSIQTQILALEGDRVAQARFFSTALNTQLATMEKMRGIAASIAPAVYTATTGAGKPRAAGGYMPTVMAEANDISKGVGGARPSDRPVVIPNFSFGNGKKGTMVAHTGEHIVPNYKGSGGSAIFNREMVGRMGLPSGAQKIGAAGGFVPNFARDLFLDKFGLSRGTVQGEWNKFRESYKGGDAPSAKDAYSSNPNVINAYTAWRNSPERRNLRVGESEQKILSKAESVSGKAKYAFVYNSNKNQSNNLPYKTEKGRSGIFKAIGVAVEPQDYLYDEVRSGLINSAKNYAKKLNINPDIVNDNRFADIVGQSLNRGSVESALGTVFESSFQGAIGSLPGSQIAGFDLARNSDSSRDSIENLKNVFNKIGASPKDALSNALTRDIVAGDFKNALNASNQKSFFNKIDNYENLPSSLAKSAASGYIPNFANYVYDSDRLTPELRASILPAILATAKPKAKDGKIKTKDEEIRIIDGLLGPAGSGKSTFASQIGPFIKSMADVKKAERFTILSASSLAKDPSGISKPFRSVIEAIKNSGGILRYLNVSDEEIKKRRENRIANGSMEGDLRSESNLKGVSYASLNQPEFLDILKQEMGDKFKLVNGASGYIPNFVSKSREMGRGDQGAFYKLGEHYDEKSKKTTPVGVKRFNKDRPNKEIEIEWIVSEYINKSLGIPGVSGPRVMSTLEESKRKRSIRKEVISDPIATAALGPGRAGDFGTNVLFNALLARGLETRDLHGRNYTVNKKAENYIKQLKSFPSSATDVKSTLTEMGNKGSKINILDHEVGKITNPSFAMEAIRKIMVEQSKQASGGYIPNFAKNQEFDKSLLANSKIDPSSPMLSLKAGDQTNYGKFLKIEPAGNPKGKYLNAIFESFTTGRNVKYSSDQRKRMEFGGGLFWDSVRKEIAPNKNLKNRLYSDDFYSSLANPASKYADVSSKMKVFFDSKGKLDGENLRMHEWNSGTGFSDNISVDGKNLVIEDINPNFDKPIQFNNLYLKALNQAAADLKLKVIKRSSLSNKISNKGESQRFREGFVGSIPKSYAKGYIPNFAVDTTKSQSYIESQRKRNFKAKTYRGASGIIGSLFKTLPEKFFSDGVLGDSAQGMETNGIFDLIKNSTLYAASYGGPKAMNLATEAGKYGLKISSGLQKRLSQLAVKGALKIKGYAGGYIPNFADPLNEAISREIGAGVNPSQVYIDQNNSLKNPMNPSGLMVANRRDEPSGGWQGINRARKEGANAQTYGASRGFVPNFAPQIGEISRASIAAGKKLSDKDIDDFNKALKDIADNLKKGNIKLSQALKDVDIYANAIKTSGKNQNKLLVSGNALVAAYDAEVQKSKKKPTLPPIGMNAQQNLAAGAKRPMAKLEGGVEKEAKAPRDMLGTVFAVQAGLAGLEGATSDATSTIGKVVSSVSSGINTIAQVVFVLVGLKSALAGATMGIAGFAAKGLAKATPAIIGIAAVITTLKTAQALFVKSNTSAADSVEQMAMVAEKAASSLTDLEKSAVLKTTKNETKSDPSITGILAKIQNSLGLNALGSMVSGKNIEYGQYKNKNIQFENVTSEQFTAARDSFITTEIAKNKKDSKRKKLSPEEQTRVALAEFEKFAGLDEKDNKGVIYVSESTLQTLAAAQKASQKIAELNKDVLTVEQEKIAIEQIDLNLAKEQLITAMDLSIAQKRGLDGLDKRLISSKILNNLSKEEVDNLDLLIAKRDEDRKLSDSTKSLLQEQINKLNGVTAAKQAQATLQERLNNLTDTDLQKRETVIALIQATKGTLIDNEKLNEKELSDLNTKLDLLFGMNKISKDNLALRNDETVAFEKQNNLVNNMAAKLKAASSYKLFSGAMAADVGIQAKNLQINRLEESKTGKSDEAIRSIEKEISNLRVGIAQDEVSKRNIESTGRARSILQESLPKNIDQQSKEVFSNLANNLDDAINMAKAKESKALENSEERAAYTDAIGKLKELKETTEFQNKSALELATQQADMVGKSKAVTAALDLFKNSLEDIPQKLADLSLERGMTTSGRKLREIDYERTTLSEMAQMKGKRTPEEIMAYQRERSVKGIGQKTLEAFSETEFDRANRFSDTLVAGAERFRDTMIDGMIETMEKGGSLGDILQSAAYDFSKEMTRASMRNVFSSLVPSPVLGLASGGKITGGSGNKDDVPAMLMGGEYVMNKRAVSKYGTGFMEALNNGSISGFADGGSVVRSRGFGSNVLDSKNIGDQTGQGGYQMPGYYGSGAITGGENLLDYATQSYTSGAGDRMGGGANSAYLDLDPESIRLTQFGRTTGPMAAAIKESKQQAFGLYTQELEAEKQAAKEREEKKKAFKNMILMAAISTVASAGIGAISSGVQAGIGSVGKGAKFMDMLGAGFKGAYSGGTINGQNVGGLKNLFSGNFAMSQIGSSKELGMYNLQQKLSTPEGMADFERILASGADVPFKESVIQGYTQFDDGTGPVIISRATGGSIPQTSGIDTVPAMLSGGEFVMNAAATQRIGANNLNAMNSGASTSNDSSAINDQLLSKLDELIRTTKESSKPVTVNVSSQQTQSGDNREENKSEQDQNLSRKIKAAVVAVLQEEKRLGGVLRRN